MSEWDCRHGNSHDLCPVCFRLLLELRQKRARQRIAELENDVERLRSVPYVFDAETGPAEPDLGAYVDAMDRIAKLEAAIKGAPHSMSCHSIRQEFLHKKDWGTLEYCDCWKVKALEKDE